MDWGEVLDDDLQTAAAGQHLPSRGGEGERGRDASLQLPSPAPRQEHQQVDRTSEYKQLLSYFSYSALGIDVALEEINHLLEVDLTDNSRSRPCAAPEAPDPASEESSRPADNLYQQPASEEVIHFISENCLY